MDREIVEAKFGPAVLRDQDSNGSGAFDAWPLAFECGLEVVLWFFADGEQGHRLEVHANDRERHHILFHLGLSGASISLWIPDASSEGPFAWRVARLDDNGHRFEVCRTTSSCEAQAVVAAMEERGHKQTFWHEPVTEELSAV